MSRAPCETPAHTFHPRLARFSVLFALLLLFLSFLSVFGWRFCGDKCLVVFRACYHHINYSSVVTQATGDVVMNLSVCCHYFPRSMLDIRGSNVPSRDSVGG